MWDNNFEEKSFMILPMKFMYYERNIDLIENQFEILTDELDREFDDDSNDRNNEYSILYSNVNVLFETAKDNFLISYTTDIPSNRRLEGKKNRNQKTKAKAKTFRIYSNRTSGNNTPPKDRGDLENYLPIFRSGTEKNNSLSDIIVTDRNVKVILQLPVNNRKEDVKVIIYNDNSLKVTYLNSNGKPSHFSVFIPYKVDMNTARSTYRNGILEVALERV
jgi:HSP20 family molecular chaperone IbpA